ncbi:immunoglobulin e-set [Trichococcus palustris]|jgi:pullulanase|uniref:Immunoglobulin e-set n=1 Tax=Trichococcus palustris TaxID=140314 RepID=A0A143YUS1_9LACT|nr:type I pullulanase [Trichococcus palustris]CZQ97269.1 immunoglobulin e-set [Trichococcus palustris]SFK75954.1 pullulanase [Trichococcus palustris]
MYIQVDERKRTDVLSTKYYQYNIDNLEDRPEQIVASSVFDKKYSFDGTLGANYSPTRTILRVWAPTAESVDVILYDGLYDDRNERYAMEKGERGTHELLLMGDYAGKAYKYAITFPNGDAVETVDPYSYATTVNGERSVILDYANTNPENWGKRLDPITSPVDAIIYELHIRDFTISPDSGTKNKGKFLGVIEAGTASPDGRTTGLDYLKELGVTHVQILPMADFFTVDEKNPSKTYNWGYDPQNFNVPEGSYATDPYQPEVRILEMKEMIQGLHDAGIRVIMDVVYNHVYLPKVHPLEKTVPGYYFRRYADGTLSNGTGVGNDTASERYMMRKYIVDSITYWAKNFNLDGFRFDLMGIHDVDTMNVIRAALDEIDPSIIMLGEGWNLNTNLAPSEKAIQQNADRMQGIAQFNDALREAVKGSDFDFGNDTGFITGKPFMEGWVATNLQGGAYYPANRASYTDPAQMVQYVEAHDNLTLYDKLLNSMPWDDEETRERRHLLASSLVLLSQGVPFIHAGQEYMRTKHGVENSYNAPDEINRMDWKRRDENGAAVDYLKGLIQLRKSEPLFRLKSIAEIKQHMNILKAEYQIVVYQLEDESALYYVVFNGQGNAIDFDVESGDYFELIHDCKNYMDAPQTLEKLSKVHVERLSTTVIVKLK